MTDNEILTSLRGERYQEAFRAIVDNYSERLYWHVRRFLCSHEDTDDLLQDIFIKVWNSLPSFRGDSKLFTWLYRIATNEALNHLRKMKIRSALRFESLEAVQTDLVDSDPWFNGDALERNLSKAILTLPDKQRAVFMMRYYDDMDYSQISQILGTSEGALKASYHIARRKIEDYFREKDEDCIKPPLE
ncbi:MAG: RNA polymerase sigma factor [Candidatus Cryptobacteroides sp.]